MVTTFKDPKFVIAYTIILGFASAYIYNPSETMNGALIAAFAGAWGYYLGSSNSSNAVREQVGQALDLASKVAPDSAPAAHAAEQVAGAAVAEADKIKGMDQ